MGGRSALSHGLAIAAVAAALAGGRLIGGIAPFRSGLFLFVAIVFSAWWGGLGPGLMATSLAIVGSLLWDPPPEATNVYWVESARLGILGLAGVLTSSM